MKAGYARGFIKQAQLLAKIASPCGICQQKERSSVKAGYARGFIQQAQNQGLLTIPALPAKFERHAHKSGLCPPRSPPGTLRS